MLVRNRSTKGHEHIKPLIRDFFNHTSKTDSGSKIITLAMEFLLKLSFTNRMAKSMEKLFENGTVTNKRVILYLKSGSLRLVWKQNDGETEDEQNDPRDIYI